MSAKQVYITWIKKNKFKSLTSFLLSGLNLLKGTTLGLELVNDICRQTGVLAKYAKVLKNYLQNEIEKRAAADNMLKEELRKLKEEIKDIGRHQDEIIPKHIRGKCLQNEHKLIKTRTKRRNDAKTNYLVSYV